MIDDKEYNLYWNYYSNKEKDFTKISKKETNYLKNSVIYNLGEYSKYYLPNFFKRK